MRGPGAPESAKPLAALMILCIAASILAVVPQFCR
jgi:hypothetical protein